MQIQQIFSSLSTFRYPPSPPAPSPSKKAYSLQQRRAFGSPKKRKDIDVLAKQVSKRAKHARFAVMVSLYVNIHLMCT